MTLEGLKGRNFATVREIAEVFGCDPRTIRRAIDLGVFPAIKFGRTVRIPVADALRKGHTDSPEVSV